MKLFKGLKTQNRKYVHGKTRLEYCQGDCDTDCKECVFIAPISEYGESRYGERFEAWVAHNEASINWKPKRFEESSCFQIYVWETHFRTRQLRANAIREIKKLLKTLPKG
jgi:hypothetical protein